MFAVSKKQGAVAALLGVVLLLGGCGKSASDGATEVDGVSDGTSAADSGDKGGGTDKPKADSDGNVTIDEGGVHIRINGDDVVVKVDGDKVNVDGPKPADLDLCANLPNKQADMPKGYMPSGPGKGDYKSGLFTCGKIADVIANKAREHAGEGSEQLKKLIQGEVNKSLRDAGVNVTVK